MQQNPPYSGEESAPTVDTPHFPAVDTTLCIPARVFPNFSFRGSQKENCPILLRKELDPITALIPCHFMWGMSPLSFQKTPPHCGREPRIMPPTVCRKRWQESAFLEGAKDGPPHSRRNVLSTLCVERVGENALHSESSPALLSSECWNLLPHLLWKEPRRIFPVVLWEDLKKSLPTPLPAEESSSLCVCVQHAKESHPHFWCQGNGGTS